MSGGYKFWVEYKHDGKIGKISGLDNEFYSVETVALKPSSMTGAEWVLHPKRKLELVNVYLEFAYDYLPEDKVYINGYQSWTTSREYGAEDIQAGMMGLGKYQPFKHFVRIFGDYDFQKYSLKKGEFHSYSYTYVKKGGGKILLLGSLSERTGFTVFHHYMNDGIMRIQKDVEGVTVEEPYTVFGLHWNVGPYQEAFDRYFYNLKIRKPANSRMNGYTSWYNYFGNISEEILSRDLDGLAVLGEDADIFQIDDGYQTAVGDWLSVKRDKFPRGMKFLVDKIHSEGYKAGLWLAPFNAQKSSELVKKHPDWLIKNSNGSYQLGSIAWHGAYTIDFYIPEAAEYIRKCFDGILNDWGFDMVKLDFLYSVCRTPRRNKSRGQIMTEGMEFLRECVGNKWILGCGVPLFPAFGTADFCRISSDVALSFKDPFYIKHTNREMVSAKSAINNTIFRRHLDGRAFVNDPDVFFLRRNDLRGEDKLFSKSGILKYSDEQKKLLAAINSMCGNVLFVSDNVGGYDENQLKAVREAFKPSERTVVDAEYVDANRIAVLYWEDKKLYRLTFNAETGENVTEKL